MATGRTIARYARLYVGGYDLSGETRSIGPLAWDHEYSEEAALTWDITGGLNGRGIITTGQCNTILRFDTTSSASPHDLIDGINGDNVPVLVPIGIRAAPAAGDPCWMAIHQVKLTQTNPTSGAEMVTTTIDFSMADMLTDAGGVLLNFDAPWGTLIHALAARTGANSATGIDGGGATAAGAWMIAQITACAGTGNVTITGQGAATNSDGSFSNITGLTTGAVAHTAIPCAVVAQTAVTASIPQYLRWQVSLSGITSVTFALAIARGR